MKIFVSHSRDFDFEKNLYIPLEGSRFFSSHDFIFPHKSNTESYNTKELFDNGCDLVIAEVSYPSTGQGIELGWANDRNISIFCICKKSKKLSGSINIVANDILEYDDCDSLVAGVDKIILNFNK